MNSSLLRMTTALGLLGLIAACGQKEAAKEPAPTPSTDTAITDTAQQPQASDAPDLAAATDKVADALSGLSESDSAPVRRYGIESGRIEYQVTGLQTGTETLEWDQFGAREITTTKTTTNILGIASETDQQVISLPDYITSIDTKNKSGMRQPNPIQEMMARHGETSAETLGLKMIEQFGGAKVGTDTVAGVTCDVWEIKEMGTKTCVHQGLTLRVETAIMGQGMTKVATKFETGIAIDAARFTVPADVQVSDAPVAGEMIEKALGQIEKKLDGASGMALPLSPDAPKTPVIVQDPVAPETPAATTP